jgi:hypothetical protein
MKRFLIVLYILTLVLAACGGSADPPLEERIIGTWSGAQTNVNGDKIPATWQFLEGGTMVVKITGTDISYGADWSVEGNRINLTTELAPDEPTYRDVEFVSDDVISMTKAESNIEETWTRVTE